METYKLAEQITKLYLTHADWATEKLSYEEAFKCHQDAIRCGRLISISDGDKLVGYVQFVIEHGVCYIEELFILPEYRGGRAVWAMKRRLEAFTGAKVFLGERFKRNDKIEIVTRR